MPKRFRLDSRSELMANMSPPVETLAIVAATMAALYFGRTLAIPIAIAVLISFSLGPVVTWLRRRHIGRLPAVAMAVGPALIAIGGFAFVVTAEIGHLAANVSDYQSNVEAKLASLEASLPAKGMIERGSAFLSSLESRSSPALPARNGHLGHFEARPPEEVTPLAVEIKQPTPTIFDMAKAIFGPLLDPLMSAGLVLLFVIFFLVEREDLRDRLIRLAGIRDIHRTTMAMDEAGYRLSRYLLLQLTVNSAFGIAIGCGLSVIGVPNASLWGVVAAVLRFIPYLGVAVAAILPLLLAFAVDPGWSVLAWTAVLFLGLELVVGNLVEPWLYGSSTGLSAVALVISAIFWTWLWGPIGLLLSTPLTVCLAVLARHVPQLAFLDIVLGNRAPLKPEESFYQRLLAGNPDEAAEQAADFLRTAPFVAFCDQVALPALALAERDRKRGILVEDTLAQVANGLDLVVEAIEDELKPRGGAAVEDAQLQVLCIPGRTLLDEAAAGLLVHALRVEGYEGRALELGRSSQPYFGGDPIGPAPGAVCLSYMDPQALRHTRYLGRRLRRWLGPDTTLIAGFWTGLESAGITSDETAQSGCDAAVASFEALFRALGEQRRSTDVARTEPTLVELAAKASQVLSEPA